LNKISKFFKPLIHSLSSLESARGVVKKFAPVIGSAASVIPGVGAIAPVIGSLVGSAAGSIGDAYNDYKGGKTEAVDTAQSIIDTVQDAIGGAKELYKDYKTKKKSGPQVKSGPPKKPSLLSKRILESVV
jgi:hypothetical protein